MRRGQEKEEKKEGGGLQGHKVEFVQEKTQTQTFNPSDNKTLTFTSTCTKRKRNAVQKEI